MYFTTLTLIGFFITLFITIPLSIIYLKKRRDKNHQMILDKYERNGFIFGEINVNTINVFIKIKFFLFLSFFITLLSLSFFLINNFIEIDFDSNQHNKDIITKCSKNELCMTKLKEFYKDEKIVTYEFYYIVKILEENKSKETDKDFLKSILEK